MKIKVIDIIQHGTIAYKRYLSNQPVDGYKNLTQLWVLINNVKLEIIVSINGKKYRLIYTLKKGLITDKASTPVESSDWYPSVQAYLIHDVNFTCHFLKLFAENNDEGFRATNKLFKAMIIYKIKETRKRKLISGLKYFFWMTRAGFWKFGVSTIVGQSKYVKHDGSRGNHATHTEFSICRLV